MMNLHDLNVAELRKMATGFEIPGRSRMNRPDLVKAITLHIEAMKNESLQETLEILSDPIAMNDIEDGMEEIENGETVELYPFQKHALDTLENTTADHIQHNHVRRLGNPKRIASDRKRNKMARNSRRKNRVRSK